MDNQIDRSAAPVVDMELDALQVVLGLALPADYRAFLLTHNGGIPRSNKFLRDKKTGTTREIWLQWIYSVGREGLRDSRTEDVLSAYRARPSGLPAGLLPAASAHIVGSFGVVCVACSGPDAGKVFFRSLSAQAQPTIVPLADSWTDFIEGLDREDRQARGWKIAIEDGDTAALREWLGKNPGWTKDYGQRLDILRVAVEADRWPAVEVLLDVGFAPDELFDDSLSSQRPELVLRLLRSGKVPSKAIAKSLVRASHDLWNQPALFAELVAAGADPMARRETGETPLHRAVEARSEAGVRFLLEQGADPTMENDEGRTPLDLASDLEEAGLVALLGEGEADWHGEHPADTGPEVVAFDLRGVELRQRGPALTLEDIKAFESTLRFTLPPEYRFLLLEANGGVPAPNRLPHAQGPRRADDGVGDDGRDDGPYYDGYPPEGQLIVKEFFRLRQVDRAPGTEEIANIFTVEEMRDWDSDWGAIPRDMVAIGWVEGYGYEGDAFLLLGCQAAHRGKLFVFPDEPLNLTLPDLFAALRSGAPAGAGDQAPPAAPGDHAGQT